jgi:hypothetical protein
LPKLSNKIKFATYPGVVGGGGEPLGSIYLRTCFRGTIIKSHNISCYQNRFWFGSYFELNGIMFFQICFFK